jgi:hypothetical protein
MKTTQCRYLGRGDVRCTAEVLDDSELAEIWICRKHAARVIQMIRRREATVKAARAIGGGR